MSNRTPEIHLLTDRICEGFASLRQWDGKTWTYEKIGAFMQDATGRVFNKSCARKFVLQKAEAPKLSLIELTKIAKRVQEERAGLEADLEDMRTLPLRVKFNAAQGPHLDLRIDIPSSQAQMLQHPACQEFLRLSLLQAVKLLETWPPISAAASAPDYDPR